MKTFLTIHLQYEQTQGHSIITRRAGI